jgi:hypothetical protein
MRIPDENRNLVALATVILCGAVIAAGIGWVGQPATSGDKKPVYLTDQTPVRVVGAPFAPNTDPRRR